ncbi:MAG: hypothetical protein DRJ26_03085 [Candidatus Methanomethylicota archaeon]|uniref:Glycosyltransferase 2-like domain-containing protein n=1 Tax=Thermoproteota archaeon TaxID=2056631 RepID=A0A497F377_9CREN|nr:MAG: hypothetical protein DRJ26_03085 [Candidatus Verstraetearchaeota archaeon]
MRNGQLVKVTVIMPAYNLENVIQSTITKVKQVLSEITSNYEVIVLDDGQKTIPITKPSS